jgi:solute carrier family 8 (sodium/calcium exchanger)
MGPAYFVFLFYLFLGISISADIFMEAIEVITSTTVMEELWDPEAERTYTIDRKVWNPTLANLTLMAFGSSAPEIILSVLEALKDLGKPAGELGPSTIVGSAAFNLLIISAVSVLAVGTKEDPEVKKIDDVGVFLTTASFSVFAYIWLYLCLVVNTHGEVTFEEALWTCGFFFILLILAFSADKYNQCKKEKLGEAERTKENKRKMNKA